MERLINIGYGNVVNSGKVVSVLNPDSAPIKRLIQSAKDNGNAVDATQGRRTRSVIIADGNYVILSALMPDTIAGRFNENHNEMPKGESNE
ncbi:DUF370 domain-containing protein [Parasporobacterium paucivorans]|uniref:Putative regulatory protein SAMN02745691_01087 n=1 Tax=Parasporobacterium paucivorans DSM 15970 TaxID=1122934 RepID=A0A1M6FA09_9FIRM|nr:DUF370 domain-containing protein [Parasporobacterium paucivorans]SHI94486.1 hypothetical protein SAMN02745691_01087 [Parasporobacterium paucivorans DSM 15970]